MTALDTLRAAPALTYSDVKALSPCSDSFRRVSKLLGGETGWNGNQIDAEAARKAGCTFDDIVWIASALARKDADVERRLRLWMADCAARVLHIHEKTETSDAPRNAIIAARQFARGEIDPAARAAARDAAWVAARAAARAAARDAAWAAARAPAWAAARAAAWAAARAAQAAAWAAAWAAARAAWVAEEQWQFDRLIAWLSDNEPNDWPLPDRAIKNMEK